MIANYHTHTWRCRHASGTEVDYIRRAIDSGLQVLGFSDHTPYWFDSDYYSTFRMFPEQLEDYVQTAQSLKKQYASQIDIYVGLEAEYYPQSFSGLMEHLQDYPIDYLILGQHYIGEEIGQVYLGAHPTADPAYLEAYCNQCIDGLYTGVFSCFAHPDVLGFLGEAKVYQQHMRRLCRAAKECNIPLEINFQGLRRGRHYPNLLFWETAAEEGCSAVLGCDAHKPADIAAPEEEANALTFASACGIELLSQISLFPIN